jgi:hypothetical protein
MYILTKALSSNKKIENYHISYKENKNIGVLRFILNDDLVGDDRIKMFYVIANDCEGYVLPITFKKANDKIDDIKDIINKIPKTKFPMLNKKTENYSIEIVTSLGLKFIVSSDKKVHPCNTTDFIIFQTKKESQDFIDNKNNTILLNEILYKCGDSVSSLNIIPFI